MQTNSAKRDGACRARRRGVREGVRRLSEHLRRTLGFRHRTSLIAQNCAGRTTSRCPAAEQFRITLRPSRTPAAHRTRGLEDTCTRVRRQASARTCSRVRNAMRGGHAKTCIPSARPACMPAYSVAGHSGSRDRCRHHGSPAEMNAARSIRSAPHGVARHRGRAEVETVSGRLLRAARRRRPGRADR